MSYPATIDNAEDLYIAINNFSTTCSGLVSAGQTGIAVADVTRLPPSGMVSIDDEVIFYEYISGLVLSNCHRGYDNTTPSQHADGSRVEVRWVAEHHNRLSVAIRTIESILGVDPRGGFLDVAERLAKNLPIVTPMASASSWVITHDRKRVVDVQLWRRVIGAPNPNTYERFTAPITQVVDFAGISTVTAEFGTGNAEEGYIVVI